MSAPTESSATVTLPSGEEPEGCCGQPEQELSEEEQRRLQQLLDETHDLELLAGAER